MFDVGTLIYYRRADYNIFDLKSYTNINFNKLPPPFKLCMLQYAHYKFGLVKCSNP